MATATPLVAPLRHQLFHRTVQRISSPLHFRRQPFLHIASVALLSNPIFSNVAGLLSTLWDGILNAVPKKKSSYSRKRKRQLHTSKRLKDLTALSECSGCGRLKRMHVLCPFCVKNIKDMWAGRLPKEDGASS